ncbi:MAG: helix-turn-helix transcriptional regulator [Kiritimatiellae bacterium]|nr:helix-turn-helix transcriptional regulator [Kiritimatiellia bacterium]
MNDTEPISWEQSELAERLGSAHFRILGQLPACPSPWFIAHGRCWDPKRNMRPHVLNPPRHTFFCCLAGGARVHIGKNRTMSLSPGQGYLAAVGEPHVSCFPDPPPGERLEHMIFQFLGEAADIMARSLINRYGRIYEIGTDSAVGRRILALCHRGERVLEMTASDAASVVMDLIHSLMRSGERDRRISRRVNLAESAEQAIREQLAGTCSVDRLARRFKVSREHLSRLFHTEYGVPIHEYVNRLRIREACRLLRETNLPQKTVMAQVGFAIPSTFYRVFHKELGATPRRYRAAPSAFAV